MSEKVPLSPPRKRQRLSLPIQGGPDASIQVKHAHPHEDHPIGSSQSSRADEENMLYHKRHSIEGFPIGSSSQESGSSQSAIGTAIFSKPPAFSGFSSASAHKAAIQPITDPDNPFVTGAPKHPGLGSAKMSAQVQKPYISIDDESSARFSNRHDLGGAPSKSVTPGITPFIGFTSAAQLASQISDADADRRSPTPEEEPQKDYSAFFAPIGAPAVVGFAAASIVASQSAADQAIPALGFTTANKTSLYALSEDALRQAEARMRLWDADDASMPSSSYPRNKTPPPAAGPAHVTSPSRRILGAVENSPTHGRPPNTTAPAGTGFSTPEFAGSRSLFQTAASADIKGKAAVRPFKSPLIRAPVPQALKAPAHTNSPLNPNRPAGPEYPSSFTPARNMRALMPITPMNAAAGPSLLETPIRNAAFSTPPRAAGATPFRLGTGTKKFQTPFKPGMRPGEPGRKQLEEQFKKERAAAVIAAGPGTSGAITYVNRAGKARKKFFDLKRAAGRQSLTSSGLVPGAHSASELDDMGIPVSELRQITPETALFYAFHSAPADDLANPSAAPTSEGIFGATVALQALRDIGCSLATKAWVDNHWGLILWKLAGMVCLEPERESTAEKRWCWGEVMRQLRYRYERELNGASRPALRLITTQDAPAASPMVLCISKILWPEANGKDDGLALISHPELEVTDGWYRLRAQVDGPLARAIRKGAIQVGRKIAVAGAKITTQRSEPCEVLEAYDSCQLVLSGNCTHLAPWHTKLGFQLKPFIATLGSLSPDGGTAQLMNLIVTKVYPIAFLEFFEENGKKRREGPRKEKEELLLQDQWMKRREKEQARLRSELEDKINIYEDWADRLERRSGSHFHPTEDDPQPNHIEDIFDELDGGKEFSVVTARISLTEAGWLARFIRDKIAQERAQIGEEIERDLKHVCPPRDVRSFRVLFMKDACSIRKPSQRTAEITVWDVMSLSFDEGKQAGNFAEGQRFLVTNLIPSQQSAWMKPGEGSHIYLSTRRDSRWTRIKTR